MKILLINSLYEPYVVGGAERVVRGLAEGLRDAGHDTEVLSLGPEGGRAADTVGGLPVHRVPLKNLYWPFGGAPQPAAKKPFWHMIDAYNPVMGREAGRILDQVRPDVVHTHNLAGFSTAVWKAVKQRNIPLVHTLHDYYLMCPRTSMYRDGQNCEEQHRDCWLYTRPRQALAGLPDAVVGISRFILDRHARHGYFATVARQPVIPNSYPADQVPSGPARSSSEPFRFGYIGQITEIKGIEQLLQAAKQLPGGGWELLIAGKGPEDYQQMLRTTYASPNVRFLGFTRAEDFYRDIDVLVVPSLWHEPFGMVVIEAFAHGVPVLGSRRGALPELIEHGRTGMIFDPDSPSALHDTLLGLIGNRGQVTEMRPNCLERARDFPPDRVIREYGELYAETVGTTAPTAGQIQ